MWFSFSPGAERSSRGSDPCLPPEAQLAAELQKRYMALSLPAPMGPQSGLQPPLGHIPGLYPPPANFAAAWMQQERLEALGGRCHRFGKIQ